MSVEFKRASALVIAVACVLSAGVGFLALSALIDSGADGASLRPELDPNDCSRGIDESNQETCDSLGGGQ